MTAEIDCGKNQDVSCESHPEKLPGDLEAATEQEDADQGNQTKDGGGLRRKGQGK
jgi:hypothetical protein